MVVLGGGAASYARGTPARCVLARCAAVRGLLAVKGYDTYLKWRGLGVPEVKNPLAK